jgi:hypothetical protein
MQQRKKKKTHSQEAGCAAAPLSPSGRWKNSRTQPTRVQRSCRSCRWRMGAISWCCSPSRSRASRSRSAVSVQSSASTRASGPSVAASAKESSCASKSSALAAPHNSPSAANGPSAAPPAERASASRRVSASSASSCLVGVEGTARVRAWARARVWARARGRRRVTRSAIEAATLCTASLQPYMCVTRFPRHRARPGRDS